MAGAFLSSTLNVEFSLCISVAESFQDKLNPAAFHFRHHGLRSADESKPRNNLSFLSNMMTLLPSPCNMPANSVAMYPAPVMMDFCAGSLFHLEETRRW